MSPVVSSSVSAAPTTIAVPRKVVHSRTDVRLPPALEAFLLAVINSCDLDHRLAINPPNYQPRRFVDRLVSFSAIVEELPRIYGDPKPYEGPLIQNLDQYIEVVEPTRVKPTGSLRGDAQALFELMSSGTIRPAATVRSNQFANSVAKAEAEFFEYQRTQKLKELVGYTAGNGHMPPTVVASVIKGVLGVLMTSGGIVSALRAVASTPENNAETKGVDANGADTSKQGKGKTESVKETPVVANALAPSLLTLAGVKTLSSGAADAIEHYQNFGTNEQGVIDLIGRLARLSAAQKIDFLKEMENQFKTVVIPNIHQIGDRIANSPELATMRDETTRRLLTVFFSNYQPTLETDSMLNIILDILRSPLDTADYKTASILLRHYDPIAHQFFQTVTGFDSEESGELSGPVAEIFKALRDDGLTVPFAQVQEMLDQDKNGYPLEDTSEEPIKAGKLFQIHTAKWRNDDGSHTPVVVRVLKPGIEERLEQARVRLKRLAGLLADALRDSRGRGPSARRVEQLVDMIYRNLREEIRIDRTVENQNRGAKRLSQTRMAKIPGGTKVRLISSAPRAYPALPASKIMVMEQVQNPVPLSRMKVYHPEVVEQFGDFIWDINAESSLIGPMKAALAGLVAADGEEDLTQGFMHADLHTGNFLFVEPTPGADGIWEYHVKFLDFGLVVNHSPTAQKDLVQLAVGAGYNSIPFIVDALWSLRDPNMNDLPSHEAAKKREKLLRTVEDEVKVLNQEKRFQRASEWVKLIWEMEILDLPDWLVLMEKGFRSVDSAYIGLGNKPEQLATKEADYAIRYRELFYKYLKTRTKGHKGWKPVYRYEVSAFVGRCGDMLLSFVRRSN